MIGVMVVAASHVIRAGLSAVIAGNPQMTVVGSVSDIDGMTKEIQQLQLDVVLLDWGRNSQSDWDKLLVIQEQQDSLRVMLIVKELEGIDIEAALRSGVRGILLDTSTESEILTAIEAIALGLIVIHPDVLEFFSVREKAVTNPVQSLTPREIEVLQMLGSGLGNKAIAQSLHISDHTVKFHVSSIFQKLAVSTRTEAVTVGVRLGLILL
ncbi:two component transcriptional regulator, LuxR family [Trichormus variabilis ATCC 29413]|uniref:Two component transcriptional regulator, LuxR family n=2 Tax=Anabaena variabilis TaxID=264691 RepID=Q3M8K5_TRIV2|nr:MULTISPECIES: response regulator transcription factor [Nostocaceae]ABA22681.1 two component transcriptional regulator, LuxR family [Trichormus variabilis ATCC 29413]MBC1216218.1 response regulator transcription factor [Trichormus variabilis ARAD]MBC1258418.1 response regulator transcription factor [Trichormus variabilis V5]MBC1267412.1 response regulator transcription factor [Trichormus variabilis FSR]MBC1304633.1 response regulator transcription factor [Trichormus variabilis N2B]